MSLTKETFEEAKKKATERIAEWVAEAKTAGICRLQDRYDKTFTRIEWRNKSGVTNRNEDKKRKKEKKVQGDGEKKDHQKPKKIHGIYVILLLYIEFIINLVDNLFLLDSISSVT